jgi:hypothetical protein
VARRLASLIPFYEYGPERFFCSDDAPAEVAERRRAGFMRLAELYRNRFAKTIRVTDEARADVSDLQFTDAHRVPFQYSRFVHKHLRVGAFVASSSGVTITDLDGNVFYDLAASYGVNVFGYDFYKDIMERGHQRARARRRQQCVLSDTLPESLRDANDVKVSIAHSHQAPAFQRLPCDAGDHSRNKPTRRKCHTFAARPIPS